jgi:hypothetical protein
MSVGEWTAVGGFVITILAAVYSSMRLLVRSILRELTPNGGTSLKDQVNRIESRVDALYMRLME